MDGRRLARLMARGCLAVALAGAAVLTSSTGVAAAEGLRTSVTVRVYQTAGLPPEIEQRALAEAARVLRGAFVDVAWRHCGSWGSATACSSPPDSSELLLRIALEGTLSQRRPPTLGEAVIGPCDGGVLAKVFVDRVETLADEAETDIALLLGRVTAHELAHLMMHTSVRHSRRGLMRPNWTPEEIRRNRAEDWLFTPEDVAAIRR